MKFINGKKNSYVLSDDQALVIAQFKNGIIETEDPKLIEILQKRYPQKGTKVVEAPKVVIPVDTEEDDLPLGDIDNSDLEGMKQNALKLEMAKYGLTFKVGLNNKKIVEMIKEAREKVGVL